MKKFEINPLDLPRQEDVSETDAPIGKLRLIRITDENRDGLLKIVLSTYLGEKCKFCLRQFNTIDELNDAVFAGCHPFGRIACKACWDKYGEKT